MNMTINNSVKPKQRRQYEVKHENAAQKEKSMKSLEKMIHRHNLECSDGEDEELDHQVKEVKMLEHKMRQDLN